MAEPDTNFVGGPNAQVATYTLAPGLWQYVESILVQIDNTAGGDIRPELSIATPSGVVMATKRQGETIPAGDTGTATWALRLTDEVAHVGGWQVTLKDLDQPAATTLLVFASAPPPSEGPLNFGTAAVVAATWTFPANDRLFVSVANGDTVARTFQLYALYVQRLDVMAAAKYRGNAVIVAPGVQSLLSVTTLDGGPALLDLTNPVSPKIVAAGVYALTLEVVGQ